MKEFFPTIVSLTIQVGSAPFPTAQRAMLTPADRARWSAPFPMGFYYYRRTAAGLVWREGFAIETVHFLQRKYEPDSRCLVNFDSQCYCGDPSGGLSAPGSSVSRCVRTPMQIMVGDRL